MKQKTHSGAKKRIKINGKGKMFTKKAAKNHLLSSKSKRQKGSFLSGMPLNESNTQKIRRLMPNSL
jgi:large subunit ribosomal protein L35